MTVDTKIALTEFGGILLTVAVGVAIVLGVLTVFGTEDPRQSQLEQQAKIMKSTEENRQLIEQLLEKLKACK